MKKVLYNKLPWLALFSGVLMVILIALAIVFKSSKDVENPVNRKIAYDKLTQLQIDSREAINSQSFHDYVNKALSGSVINTKWLISDKGIILYANGMMAPGAPVNSSIYSSIDKQSKGLLNAVDESLDLFQKELIYIAARIRSEGEHNDVLGHIVLPLKTGANELAGFVAVAYELDNSPQSNHMYVIISFALLITFILYWLSLPLWVYFDSRSRNEKYILWVLFVLIGNLPAYIAYLLSKSNN
jgi:hypothetical protein